MGGFVVLYCFLRVFFFMSGRNFVVFYVVLLFFVVVRLWLWMVIRYGWKKMYVMLEILVCFFINLLGGMSERVFL